MLNATDADTAINELTYDRSGTKEERNAARAEYDAKSAEITGQFKVYLADQYASEYPVAVQDLMFSKAYEDSSGSGFGDIEHYYGELADFAASFLRIIK